MRRGEEGQKLRMRPGDPIPYRGDFPVTSRDDPSWKQPQTIADAQMRIFDFSDPDDLEDYNEILDKVAKERAGFGHCEYHYDDKTDSWRAMIHWYEVYKESAENARKKKLTT